MVVMHSILVYSFITQFLPTVTALFLLFLNFSHFIPCRHAKNPSEITVHPWPESMCMDIISDKHWLTENIICLLSNTVKYSNGGVVKILIEHVQSVNSEDEKVDEVSTTDQPSEIGRKSISFA